MLGKRSRVSAKREDAQLDITSFMNLMIVLVPVLLMMMVFSRITVVELQMPALSNAENPEDLKNEQLEVLVTNEGLQVYFPQGYLLKDIPLLRLEQTSSESTVQQHDFALLQDTLKQVKQALKAKGVEKQDLVLLVDENVPYQTLVSLIDTSRSYKDVVAASLVDAELFPHVSFADAPVRDSSVAVADAVAAGQLNQGAQ